MASIPGNASSTLVSADALSSIFRAIGGLRNVRAAIAALSCAIAAVLLAGVVLAVFRMAGAPFVGAFLAFVIAVVLGQTAVNAQGILLLDQARGVPMRRLSDAIMFGLMCVPKQIAISIGLLLVVLGAVLVIAIAFFLCKIPFLGPLLFAVVFPASVLLFGFTFFGLLLSLAMLLPAVWSGATVSQAFAQLIAVIRRRLTEGLVMTTVAIVFYSLVVAPLAGAIVFAGLVPTAALSASIVGAGGGDLTSVFSEWGIRALSGYGPGSGGGYVVAGMVGTAILWVFFATAVLQVLLMSFAIIYDKLTEGIDTSAEVEAVSARVSDAKRRAAELGDRARQAAERAREQAQAAARAASSGAAARPPAVNPHAAVPEIAGQIQCRSCGQLISATDKFCGHCGARTGDV